MTVSRVILGAFACLAGVAGASLAAATIGLGLRTHNIWYFPGDPPVLDLALIPASAALLFGVVAILSLREQASRRLGACARLSCLWAFVVFVFCLGGIGFRFTPAWKEVREGIRHYGDQIAAEVGSRHRVLTTTEFEDLKAKYMPQPISVRLSGFGTVNLRMAHGVYPYIGVDFGSGSHALFNPRTMICSYAD